MDEQQPLLDSSHGHSAEQEHNGKHTLVEFDPNGDPDNPLEWPTRYKWSIVLLLAFMAFTVTFTCIGLVPVAGQIVRDLEGRERKSASVLFVTIWELGEAAGPLFTAPLSEVYGRYPVFIVANTLFIVGTVITALSQSTGVAIFARFLTGCAVAGNVLNPSIIGDLFPSESRGSAMSIVMLAPLLGGAVGPAIAGAIAESAGWREIMFMAVGLAGACQLAFLILLRETYKVTILQKRAAKLRKETGNGSYKTEFDQGEEGTAAVVLRSMMRPTALFFSSFILQIMSLWGALNFAFFYVMSTTLPDMLQDIYGFGPALTGTSFLTFSVGSLFAILVCNALTDRIYVKLLTRQDEKAYPEGRLPLAIAGAFALPPIIALFGWAADLRWPVWVLLLAVILLGFCLVLCMVNMMTYVTDAFGLYSASAFTAVLITRCLMGTFLPLATAPLTAALGNGLGFTILAVACLALAPIPPLVMRYGPRWRQWSRFTRVQ